MCLKFCLGLSVFGLFESYGGVGIVLFVILFDIGYVFGFRKLYREICIDL